MTFDPCEGLHAVVTVLVYNAIKLIHDSWSVSVVTGCVYFVPSVPISYYLAEFLYLINRNIFIIKH